MSDSVFEFPVSGDRIERFFQATGWQLAHRPAVPPTLATIFRQGEFEVFSKLSIPLSRVLHGEQKYRFLKDLLPGATYVCATRLANQYEKGALKFVVLQTDVKETPAGREAPGGGGATCLECFTTIIVKGAL